MIARIVLVFSFICAACSTETEIFPSATYDAGPPLTVVGHWNLEPAGSGSALWIEADGTYTERDGLYPSPSDLSFLTSGTWTLFAPTLTFRDASNGADYRFRVENQPNELVLVGTRTWLLTADQPDAGGN